MSRQRFFLPALCLLTLVRWLLLPLHGLAPVEQHALEASRHLGLWHDGMGPFIPILVKISTFVFGEGAFGVRYFAPLLMLMASLLLWEVVRGLFDATVATWSVVVLQLIPAVNVAALTMTPMTMGITASVAVMAALRLALHRQHKWHLYWWCLGGGLVLCFLVDWRLLMLAVSSIISLCLTPRGRRALLRWPVMPLLGLCLGLPLTIFLAWNSEHQWRSLSPLPGAGSLSLWSLGIQALLAFSPLVLLAAGWALMRSATRRPVDYSVAFLYAYAWPLITLDVLCWSSYVWPMTGTGAWVAPVVVLLSFHGMAWNALTPRWSLVIRGVVMAGAAAQSLLIVTGTLPSVFRFAW